MVPLVKNSGFREADRLCVCRTPTQGVRNERLFLVQYVGRVFENKVDAGIVRLKVKDADVPGSPAWKAVFSILNDRAGLFTVTTDRETNDGLLKTAKLGVSSEETAAATISSGSRWHTLHTGEPASQ